MVLILFFIFGVLIVMFVFGYMLNIMMLGGLVFVVGILVDEVIVMIESINVYLEEGKDVVSVIIDGV